MALDHTQEHQQSVLWGEPAATISVLQRSGFFGRVVKWKPQ